MKASLSTRSGAALVVTLSILVLLTALVLSLFLSVTTERVESSASANQGDARRLAYSVVDLVKSTISQASSGYESDASGNAVTTAPAAWACQPGLIRTWKADGTPDRSFRLYSSGALMVTGSLDLNAEFNDLVSWKSGTTSVNAIWCDLNAPSRAVSANGTEDGALAYPITVPPADINSGSAAMDSANGVPTDNPSTDTQEGVQGFAVTSAPGFDASQPASPANNPAPMPVRWLYVLQDGTFVSPLGNGTAATIPGAAKDNPVIGRIGYWTDDESAKININTASEGVYWDKPYGVNREDSGLEGGVLGFSLSIPVQDEFQRLPGHPSFTSLSAVFGGWLPRPQIGFASSGTAGASGYTGGTFADNILPYYNLNPRIGDGGTRGGTRQILDLAAAGSKITLDPDRLYASMDEILYRPTLASGERQLNDAQLTADRVGRTQFFLTSSSRAPETTLFEQPRISLWPIQQSSSEQNARDRLLAFASTFQGNNAKYHFQRAGIWQGDASPGPSQNPTADAAIERNGQLLNYLHESMSKSLPGYGASLAAKYPNGRLAQILGQTFDTLRSGINSTSRSLKEAALPNGYSYVPYGTSGSASNAVGLGSAVPARLTIAGSQVKGLGKFPTISEAVIVFMATDWKDETRLADAAPWTPVPGADSLPDDVADKDGNFNGIGDPQTTKVQAFLLLIPAQPAPGQPAARPAVRYQVEGLQSWTLNGQSMGFPNSNNTVAVVRSTKLAGTTGVPGIADQLFSGGLYTNDAKTAGVSDGITSSPGYDDAKVKVFPLISGNVTLAAAANAGRWGLDSAGNYQELRPASSPSTMTFSGGTIKVRVFPGAGNSFTMTDEVQEIEISFTGPVDLPVPLIVRPLFTTDYRDFEPSFAETDRKNPAFYSGIKGAAADGRSFDQRMTANPVSPWNGGMRGADSESCRIRRGDVIRSVQLDPAGPARGDIRAVAALRSVPSNFFATYPDYASTSILQACGAPGNHNELAYRISVAFGGTSLTANPHNWVRPQSRDKSLNTGKAANLAYGSDILPNVPFGLAEARMNGNLAGDWNTGVGGNYDGAYINMADQGFVSSNDYAQNVYFPSNVLDSTSTQALTTFSPNRQVASPVLLGSLPTGITPDASAIDPWRTLLFCPHPAAANAHPGFGTGTGGPGPETGAPFSTIPDHVFLDFFWMPVVEPYAISDSFSTSGKININTRLAPFSHITRNTGLHALLKAVRMPVLPDGRAGDYKMGQSKLPNSGDTAANLPSWRYNLDVEAVAAGMNDRKFSKNDLFRSASEICTVSLVPVRQPGSPASPAGPSGADPLARYNATAAWWSDKKLSGDNVREAPYDALYSRVTTKSNSFTVHYRVQALKQLSAGRTAASDWERWDEARDQVVSEFRGRTLLERYIDPKDSTIPDFVTTSGQNLGGFYRWRTIEQKQFLP